jgi:hypothetical protein
MQPRRKLTYDLVDLQTLMLNDAEERGVLKKGAQFEVEWVGHGEPFGISAMKLVFPKQK